MKEFVSVGNSSFMPRSRVIQQLGMIDMQVANAPPRNNCHNTDERKQGNLR
jgi:hypothetical protein